LRVREEKMIEELREREREREMKGKTYDYY
jgi:hypothetical protein